jgi:hypothetical protein
LIAAAVRARPAKACVANASEISVCDERMLTAGADRTRPDFIACQYCLKKSSRQDGFVLFMVVRLLKMVTIFSYVRSSLTQTAN